MWRLCRPAGIWDPASHAAEDAAAASEPEEQQESPLLAEPDSGADTDDSEPAPAAVTAPLRLEPAEAVPAAQHEADAGGLDVALADDAVVGSLQPGPKASAAGRAFGQLLSALEQGWGVAGAQVKPLSQQQLSSASCHASASCQQQS